MKIGILGGGRVGGALAQTWREAGHNVTISTRETIAATAAGADVLVLAVPSTAAQEVLAAAGPLADKVVIDATNNLSGGPDGQAIAGFARDARIVKAFNTVFSQFFHDTRPARPASLVYCGDDGDATAVAATLIEDLGFEPVDAGGSEQTAAVESFAKLVIGIAYQQGRGPFVYRFESA